MSPKGNTWNSRVLLVDDDERMHVLLRRILRMAAPRVPLNLVADSMTANDFHLESAFRGQQALEMVSAARVAGRPYAAAFVDMEMPSSWDGIETIASIRQADPELMIAIWTGHWDDGQSIRLAEVNRADEIEVILKPFHNNDICQIACNLIRRWNLGLRERAARSSEEALAGVSGWPAF